MSYKSFEGSDLYKESNMVINKQSLLIFLLSLFFITMFNPAHAYNTKNGKIFDAVGNEILIDGVAWIGFQDSNFLGGLWNVAFNPINTEHGVIELLKAPWTVPGSNVTSPDNGVSFKAIRLAMQPGIWGSVNTIQQTPFDFSRTDINNQEAGNGAFCDWTKGSDASGHCIQSKSAPDLLTATINQFNKQNILVMLDVHHRPGLGDNFRDGTVVAQGYTLKNYHDDIANFVKNAPSNVLGIDIYNEPHQLFWFQDNTQTSPTQPGWIKIIAAAASAVYDSNKNVLLFVEGPGGTEGNDPFDPVYNLSTPICLPAATKVDDTSVIGLVNDSAHCPTQANPMRVTNIGVNWGENFRSLLDVTQAINGIAKFDTTKFRTQLIQAIKSNSFSNTDPNAIADWLLGSNNDGNNGHLVFAPHLYGAQVGGWQSDANDSQIRFKWNFGFLLDAGFPFVVGELGYDIQVPGTGGEDFFLNSVAPYLINKKINHNLFFWTWNHDDYPIGVRGRDSNLTLFDWKEKDLHNLFNAIPPVHDFGTLCVTVPPPTNYTGTSFPTITASGNSTYTFNVKNFNQLTCQSNVATGNYNLTGSSINNPDGIAYVPKQIYSASVTKNTETDVIVEYVKEPTGILKVSVAGDSNCPIIATQQFTVTYSMGSVSKQLTVTSTSPVTTTLPVGIYTITVMPNPLPSNQQCKAQYNKTANITTSTTTTEAINYVFSSVGACTIDAQCSTWGTPSDSWAGSSCNFFIHTQSGMTKPTVFTLATSGITALLSTWGATATFTNGNVIMDLIDPVNNNNVGFNANGIITLPTEATVMTNGQTLTCPMITLTA